MNNRRLVILGSLTVAVVGAVSWMTGGRSVVEEEPRDRPSMARDRAVDPEHSVFVLKGPDTAAGDVQVTLQALATSGPMVTIIGEVDYDSSRLQMTSCRINPEIGGGSQVAKVLHVAEPAPGLIRAVVAGGLEVLPKAADVLACDFAVRPNAPTGPTMVRARGQVADTTFEDRSFSAEKTFVIKN
jgi:hypothetical protein